MICFPNAKINIGLNVINKRSDGYHNIETVYYPVGLCDVLEFVEDESRPNRECGLKSTGISINGNMDDNLIIRAYKLLNQYSELPGLSVHLHKIIPIGAGLGGGSSDGANMLKSINRFFKLKIGNDDLEVLAAKIGMDCPFFINNKPVFAFERGDRLGEVEIDLSGYFILLVYPGIPISTPEAYADAQPSEQPGRLFDLINEPVSCWNETIKNDFEPGIFNKYPGLKKIKDQLYELGALYASMSGSGSAIYGLYTNLPEIPASFEGFYTWTGRL